MDKVFDAIKCQQCKQVLSNPILLPCGHSICKIHSDEAGDQVKCPKCGESHQNQRFVVNSELLAVVESQIGGIDLGPCHKEAKDACAKLENFLDQIDDMIKDPVCFSYKVIDELKTRVLVKREQLKLEIDENTEQILAVLTEYQNNCRLNFQRPNLEKSMKNLKSIKKATEKQLNESLEFLNQLKVADERWRHIKNECDTKIVDLNKEFELVKNQLLMTEFDEKTDQVDFFVNIDLNHLFRWKMPNISSKILNYPLKKCLANMCRISHPTKLTLLYRGSRDGFGAGDFHMKCDNVQNTLTVIETTKGYIFGGFTNKTWNRRDLIFHCIPVRYAYDSHAFIFSLVNHVNRPFLMKIKKPEDAILPNQSFGPVFGLSDIFIQHNSNNTTGNYSKIKSYCPPCNHKNTSNILTGSTFFQVKDIEVFHLE